MGRPLAVVFDTETTGLTKHPLSPLKHQPRIIEFAGIITDGVNILHELEFKCNPGVPLDAIITKITGITDDDLVDMAPFSEYIPQLAEFFAKADVSIAHNHSFDKSLLTYDLRRANMELEEINFPGRNICTVEQTFHQYGRMMKLSELYELHVGLYVQKHRAMDDIMLLHRVCQCLGIYTAIGVLQ